VKNVLERSLLVVMLLGLSLNLNAQQRVGSAAQTERSPAKSQYTLNWTAIISGKTFDEKDLRVLNFENSQRDPNTNLPCFHVTKEIQRNVNGAKVKILNPTVSVLNSSESGLVPSDFASQDFQVKAVVRKAGNKNYLILDIVPFRKSTGKIQKLESFDLDIVYEASANRGGGRDSDWKQSSVLSSGQWYKISTRADGVYKVTYQFLEDCGFSMNQLSSASIRLYGTRAGMLSFDNAAYRPDDLSELSIELHDGNDGVFNKGDYFLFYGEDQIVWNPNFSTKTFAHESNAFADSAFYFITIDGGFGSPKRVVLEDLAASPNKTVSTYNFYDLHEANNLNLIKSGREWYGEQLGLVPSYDFGFSVPEVDKSGKAIVTSNCAIRSVSIAGVGYTMSLPNQGAINDSTVAKPVPNSYAAEYAKSRSISLSFNPLSSDFLTKIAINQGSNPNAQAWLNYIELNARRSINFLAPSMNFRDINSVGVGNISEFKISPKGSEIEVWDVSEIDNVKLMKLSGSPSSVYRFLARTDSLREFVAFSQNGLLTPSKVGVVAHQNLHSLSRIEYLIIAHESFVSQAEQLAKFHSEVDGFSSAVIEVSKIYNEFSGGAQDISAIKEFVRMIYERGKGSENELKYLLLFGDASYDFKNRISGNSNFVPSHQSKQSLVPTSSVVSDDYYGLLDENESESTSDLIDIGIGRLPARSKDEAQRMVTKILYYSNSKATYGDWRNIITLVADDPEGGADVFQDQSNQLAALADTTSPSFNIRKIYLDGYKQVAGSGGERYPDATEAISSRVEKGSLLVYYIGHGGELGWSHERVLEVPTINKWENLNNLPLFITATCEFTRFDDPRRTSAGEYVMLNPSGGGVALLTTTRAVYSGPNFSLTYSFTDQAFKALNQDQSRIGDMTAQTKIENASTGDAGNNARCFTLMGDPAMRLAFPQKQILITEAPDTIKALDKVKMKGSIVDENGNLIQSFNGLIYPTVYDKVTKIQGQNNDGQGVYFWQERKNILFRGKASVKNGLFEFEFVVPKDINREYGGGKVSLYAQNGSYDASGAYFDFIIGGLSDNPIQDNEGPKADLFMNNDKFVFGGITNQEPDLYAEIWDENGINMVGTGIGHDITGVLDNKASQTIVLNDFYEADVDSYQSGKIRYPFEKLDEGLHSLKLQVWDVNNNPSDAYTEFVVASDANLALDHILNYPNPFTTNTDFYFEHNKPGLNLSVRIEIFTVSGKLVKTIDGNYANNGFRIGPINWNGRDEYGDVIAKGVYIYRLKVRTPMGEVAEEFEKLVILK
jgi:hypothetical protein